MASIRNDFRVRRGPSAFAERRRTRSWSAVLIVAALGVWLTPRPLTYAAQHETAADVLDGERAFRNSCANCHGPDGDQIAGIDLRRGRFRRPMSDDDLVRIIRTGIPNTPMPATSMTVEQAQKIVAYLRSRAATATAGAIAGDAARGKALFESKGACTSCHRVAGVGSRVGPDLTTIGMARGAAELERSLLDPDADVQPNNRFYRVVLRDGSTVDGRLLSHDTFTVQMFDTHEQLRSFAKTDLRQSGFIKSPMPSYRATLSAQERADVVSYLTSLR
jgi:putative heme-binding domain-containing protein